MKNLLMKAIIFGFVFGCNQEENPHSSKTPKEAVKAKSDDSSDSSDSSKTDSKNSTSDKKSGSSSDDPKDSDANPTNGDDKDTEGDNVALFNEACSKISKLSLKADVSTELGYLCNGATATAKFKAAAEKAYTGGPAPTGNPEILKSTGNETELLVVGAIRVPLSFNDLTARRESILNLVSNINGVTITNKIREKINGGEGYVIESNTKATILVITIDDDTVSEEHYVKTSNPNIRFSYRFLKAGEAANSDNNSKKNKSITISLATGAKSVVNVSVRHQVVDNKGFAGPAEQRAKAQIGALTKASYDALVRD